MPAREEQDIPGTNSAPPGRTRRLPRGPRPESVPVLAARTAGLVGLLDIAAGVFPRLRPDHGHALAGLLPHVPGPFAAALSLSSGVLLVLLAPGLGRDERRAWRAALALLPTGAFAQFACRGSVLGLVVPSALLWLLLRHRDRFGARSDARSGPHGRLHALAHLVLMGASSLALGLVVVSAHPGRTVGDPSLADRIAQALYGLSGLDGPVDYLGSTSWTVALSLGSLGLLTAATTLCLALRPGRPAARLTPGDAARLRALLERHGGHDPLGRPAPRRATAVVFSPSGRAAVTYRVVSGTMLADGDPVGDVEAWPGAIERFMDEARVRSWTPAVTGCSETGRRVWVRETGLDVLGPHDGAVVDTADFSLAGRPTRDALQIAERLGRAGCATLVRRVPDLGRTGPGPRREPEAGRAPVRAPLQGRPSPHTLPARKIRAA